MIIHADMDAFYVSVELLDKPQLRDKLVAVGGFSRTRGVISAANYIARQFGVHSALPCTIATRRCPELVLLKPRMSVYVEYSKKIKEIFCHYTPTIEPLALDEAFLDTTGCEKLFGTPEAIGRKIKEDIKNDLGLTVSIGIAPNKFIAKIASDIQKPDGFVIVKQNEIRDFLDPLPITRIWGIGKVSSAKLNELGIYKIIDLRQLPQAQLQEWFGKHGIHLWQLSNGIDDRQVVTDSQAKSISHETTFDINLENSETVQSQLLHLTEQVAARLRHSQLKGRTISIKIRYADFKTVTRSHSVASATNNTSQIWKVVKEILLPKADINRQGIRLVGVGVSQFKSEETAVTEQIDMFQQQDKTDSNIDKLTDDINLKFGSEALTRGTTIKK